MAASASDYFMEVGHPGSATALGGTGYTVGDASITVGATTNWPTTTGVCFSIYEVTTVGGVSVMTAGSYNEYYGTVASATSITNVSHVTGSGTDKNYSAGASTIVTILVSDGRENRLAQGMVIEHKQTGKHSAVTADSLVVADGGNLEVDHILEADSGHGVSIDGVLLKDNIIATAASVPPDALATGAASTTVTTSETTNSTSYTGLTTPCAVTVTIGANGLALVAISANMSNSNNDGLVSASFALSGANTLASADANSVSSRQTTATANPRSGMTKLLTGLTAGETTFTMQYKTAANTGTYLNRNISVVPL